MKPCHWHHQKMHPIKLFCLMIGTHLAVRIDKTFKNTITSFVPLAQSHTLDGLYATTSSVGECSVQCTMKRFCKARGTSQLRRHLSCHKACRTEATLHKCLMEERRSIAEAAAVAARMDTLTLSSVIRKRASPQFPTL